MKLGELQTVRVIGSELLGIRELQPCGCNPRELVIDDKVRRELRNVVHGIRTVEPLSCRVLVLCRNRGLQIEQAFES